MNRKTVFGNLKKLSISPKDTDLKYEVKMVGKKLSRLMQVYQQTHLDPHLVSYKGFPPSYKNRGQGYGVWQRMRETFNVIDEKSSAALRLLEAKLVMTLRCDQDL